MKDKVKFILLSIMTLSIFVGTIVFSASVIETNGPMAVSLIIVMVPIVVFLYTFLRRSYHDLKGGIPFQDERTRKVRMYASSYAYFLSLYIWIVLLAFHKYLDRDDTLIIGLFGMFISFNFSWLIISRRKDIE